MAFISEITLNVFIVLSIFFAPYGTKSAGIELINSDLSSEKISAVLIKDRIYFYSENDGVYRLRFFAKKEKDSGENYIIVINDKDSERLDFSMMKVKEISDNSSVKSINFSGSVIEMASGKNLTGEDVYEFSDISSKRKIRIVYSREKINIPAKAKLVDTGEGNIISFKIAELTFREGLTPAQTPDGKTIYLHAGTELSEKDIASAYPGVDEYGNNNIEIKFTNKGSKKFYQITMSNIGLLLAVIIEGRVLIAPSIMQEITGGRALITGNFTVEEARRIAKKIAPAGMLNE